MPASKVAFVAGANGITGSYIIEHILSNETPFERIIATSRRPPNADWVEKDLPPNVLGGKLVWVTADLVTESVNELSAKFAEVGAADATHFYWGAYLLGDGWGSKSELELNRTMFDNCLRAVLKATNGKLERVLLQLGEKWYNRNPTPSLPQKEMSDPPQPSIAPFYEAQLTIAKQLSVQNSFKWTVTLPQCIYGATRQCAQTLATSLGVYMFAHRLLGMPLVFPGNVDAWNAVTDGSDAKLLASENVWASLEEKCAGEILNAVNGDVFQWRFMWPRLGAFFGCDVPAEDEMLKLISKEKGKKTFNLGERVTPELLEKAWRECKSSGLAQNDPGFDVEGWKPAVPFNFLDIVFSISHNLFQSMSKPRSLGFTGYIDTEESFYAIFERMQRDGVFPKGLPGREAGRAAFRY